MAASKVLLKIVVLGGSKVRTFSSGTSINQSKISFQFKTSRIHISKLFRTVYLIGNCGVRHRYMQYHFHNNNICPKYECTITERPHFVKCTLIPSTLKYLRLARHSCYALSRNKSLSQSTHQQTLRIW